jgi:hypothetical protein
MAKYSGDKFNIISISLDRDRKRFEDALTKNKMNWTQIFGNGDLIRAYNVSSIPAIFLIDPSGTIIYKSGEMTKPSTSTDDSDLKILFSILHEKLDQN